MPIGRPGNIKHTAGSNPRMKKIPKRNIKDSRNPRKPDKAVPEKLPYYPETGSNRRPGGMSDEMKNNIASRIQTWQDRNVANRGTKLNP